MLQEEEANTPCKKVYFLVQCMYLSHEAAPYHESYFELVKEIQDASPSSTFFFAQINEHIIEGMYYKALKASKELIKHEEELVENAKQAYK